MQGESYEVTFISDNSITFDTEIPVAAETATPTGNTLLSYILIGLYVGVIPVFLGMFWMPALRRLGPRWMMFLMAITAGLLIFLGIDATNEGLELAGQVGDVFQGVGLFGIGLVVTFMLLDAISRRQASIVRSESEQRLSLAFMIATGIGFHNLGEGLAIGASYSQGALALGTFLVIGFIIQNITEGLGIIIPVLKDRPSLRNLALLGLIGGGPAVLGGVIGGLLYSKILAVLFLAIGAGAVFEVCYEIFKLIQKDSVKRPMPLVDFQRRDRWAGRALRHGLVRQVEGNVMNCRLVVLLIEIAVVVAALALAVPAFAHEDRSVGPYNFHVGWHVEPALVGQLNAVELTVTEDGNPVSDVEQTLTVTISTGGVSSDPLTLDASDETPGMYTAALIPTVVGDYSFHFVGTVGSRQVDETFNSADGMFNSVDPVTDLMFPVQEPSNAELQQQIDALKAQLDALTAATPGS